MKVLHVFKTYFPETIGGIEQVMFQICEGATSQDTQCFTLSTSEKPKDGEPIGKHRSYSTKKNIELLSTPISLSFPLRLRELSERVDIVHYHFPWPFMDLAHFIAGVKKPFVVTYHSDVVRQKHALWLYAPLMHLFLGAARKIIATSPNYVASSDTLEKYKNKIEVIPIGLDENSYPPPKEEDLIKWQNKFKEPFFLFIGVLRYYKGLDTLLHACKGLPYPVVIIGDGPEAEHLHKLSDQLSLENVHFLGALPETDKIALLKLCHAAILPSHLRSEAFGISLLEAAMFGKPMISCEIGTGTTFINIKDQTGLTTRPNSPSELRDAMQWIMRHPDKSKEMGLAARERYLSKFSSNQMIESHLTLYESLLNHNTSVR